MPQMRAVMSGASVKLRPCRKPSKKRGGSKMLSSACLTFAVPDRDLERAFAFDPGELRRL